jgi:hypothetical protein
MLGWVAATNNFGIEPGHVIYDTIFLAISHIFGL